MTRIVVDPETRAKLADARQALLLCDESGQVLGQFIPSRDQSGRQLMEPQIGEEEIERRLREGGGRALAEILADLEKRA